MLSSQARQTSLVDDRVTTNSGRPPLHGVPPRTTLLAERSGEKAANSVYLSPAGTFVGEDHRTEGTVSKRMSDLAIAIHQRIESRMGSRIRNLAVRISGKTIVLEGRCATYYSKQLAQHAALGVIEDENLENDILVVNS